MFKFSAKQESDKLRQTEKTGLLAAERRNKEEIIMSEKKMGRNDPCWCGSGKKYKHCHMEFDEKIDHFRREGKEVPTRAMIKTPEQIEGIRESSKINIAVLDLISEKIHAGMTTEEIDKLVYDETTRLGGIPAPLNYEGFPKSVCTSINNQVCHGIPSEKIIIHDGDIINVDVSTIYNGYFSDSSRMFCIGNVSEEAKRLVQVTKECVELGLEQVKPWNCLGDIAKAVSDHAHSNGYSVVREIGGHGVGIEFHEDPWVGYVVKPGTNQMLPPGTNELLAPGMVFTIEPMVNQGSHHVEMDEDGQDWIIVTSDGKLSAQWEITVLVTEDGHEVLTY